MKIINNSIIPENDFRYGKLGHLWRIRNKDNIIKYTGNSVYYYIPPELVINEYHTATVDIYKVHKDYEWDNYVSCYYIKKILLMTCNLTIQEYYDLLILHINSIQNRPRCINCHELQPFSGWITHGYSKSQTNHYYCCRKCQNEYQLYLIYLNPNFYPNVAKRLIQGGINMNTLDSKIKRLRSGFISYGNPNDPCCFYIAKTASGYFKFGAAYDSWTRFKCSSYEDQYLDYKEVYYGSRIEVADLEALVKYELGDASEFIKFISTMEYFRNAFRRAVKRLTNKDYSF